VIYIKVLHIISGNDNGGGGKHVLNVCSCSKDKFYSVIGCIGNGPLYDNAKNIGIQVFEINSLIDNNLCNYIKENSIDIINFHGAKAFFMYYLMKKRINKICVATVHSDYRYDFLNSKVKHIFFTPLSKLGLKSFPYYICVSNYIKNLLEDSGFKGEKAVVNNGLDMDAIRTFVNRKELRFKYNIKEEEFVFVMVARMHPIKNHLGCIEAFYNLQKECKDVKLLLVGDGELEASLKDKCGQLKINDRIIFTGFQENPIDFVNASDISILTSFNEGGSPPIVILESGAVKKAAICSSVGDISQCINENTGYLLNPNSIEDIYNKMKEAYNNKDRSYTKGENLYKLVKERYSMNNFCNQYFNFYKKILSEHKWSEN
jgi:glycosyltransferase involved in cell wall biosynthesis